MKHLIPLLSLGGVVAGPVYYTPRGDIEVQQEFHPRQLQRDAPGSSSSLCSVFLCVLCAFARSTSFPLARLLHSTRKGVATPSV